MNLRFPLGALEVSHDKCAVRRQAGVIPRLQSELFCGRLSFPGKPTVFAG